MKEGCEMKELFSVADTWSSPKHEERRFQLVLPENQKDA